MFYDTESGIRVEVYGKSHDKYIGVKIAGVKPNFNVDFEFIKEQLKRRKSTLKFNTERVEEDDFTVVSGIENGVTNGGVIDIRIENKKVKKEDYLKYSDIPRPSTSDYPSIVKGIYASGSGAFSGRMTAPMVIAGAIFKQLLDKENIEISSKILSIGKVVNKNQDRFNKKSLKIMQKAYKDGDTLGGVISCKVKGLKIGTGGAMADGLESLISNLIFAIPSVKGIEFGSGFFGTKTLGSQNNDELYISDKEIKYSSNNDGGISGGMANGNDVVFNVAFKPIPSIRKEQNSVNLKTLENVKLKIEGRHDCTVINRVPVIVESVTAIAVYCAVLREKNADTLSDLRKEIDKIDEMICYSLDKRAKIVKEVGEYKKANNLAVENLDREKEIVQKLKNNHRDSSEYVESVYKEIFRVSKDSQRKYK